MSNRLAIVGCGGIARAHAAAAQSLGPDKCEVVALCDTDLQRATELRQEFTIQAPIFTNLEALLAEISPGAVVLCTPPATHAPLATLCLQSGVHVLCEKPLSSENSLSRNLIELATQQGLVLRTTAKYRFTDGVLAAKRRLQEKALGNIQRVEIAFGAPTPMEGRWNINASLSGGGVLMDNGPHAVDLARFLMGEVHLGDVELRHLEKYAVEEEASLKLENAAGIPIFIELSWQRTLGPTFLKVQGDRGSVDVGWESTVWHPSDGQSQIIAGNYNKNLAFVRQLECFQQSISSGIVLESQVEINNRWHSDDGMRVVEIITAAYNQFHCAAGNFA